jgi:hypothetical protein
MTELSSETRALFEMVRECDGPTPADRERVTSSLAGKLGVAVPTLLAGATTSAAAGAAGRIATGAAPATAGILSSTAAKIFIAGLVGVALGVAVVVPNARTARTEAEAPSIDGTAMTPAARATVNGAAKPDTLATLPKSEAESRANVADSVRAAHRADKPPPAIAHSAALLTREAELLAAVQAKLAANEPAGALELLDAHEREYPGGALAQERAAARVLALCQAGQTELARRHAIEFLRIAPRSPLVPRIKRSCAFASEAPAGEEQ